MSYGEMIIINDNKPANNSLYAPVYNNEQLTKLYTTTPTEFEQVLEEANNFTKDGLFHLDKKDVTIIFDPNRLPVDERIKQVLIYWIELFTMRVPVQASKDIIDENKTILFRYIDVAEAFGISYRQAKRICTDAAMALQFTGLEWSNKATGAEVHFNILQDYTTWKEDSSIGRGWMAVTFGDKFATILPKMALTWFPRNIRHLAVKYYPASSPIAIMLAVHYNRNQSYVAEHGEAVISVKKILEDIQEIPKYEVVKNATGAVFQRIIRPFIRDMDELVSKKILKSWYLTFNNGIINSFDYKSLKYDVFEKSMLHFTFVDYPIKKDLR